MWAASNSLLRDIFEWDVINWSRHIEVWEQAIAALNRRETGLEVGGRGGGLSLWMAMNGLDVICSYYNEDMTKARELHEAYGVSKRVSYKPLDVLEMTYKESFDVIMLKSTLGAVSIAGKQKQAIDRIHVALRPGGVFLFAENLAATPLHALLRSLKRGRSWHYMSLTEVESLMTPYRKLTYRTSGVIGLLGMNEVQRHVLGHVDTYLLRLMPQKWRYICMGAAFK